MKTISIINLKGGVAKTLTADNMAHVLAVFHKKRVLLVDNDKQGNTSKAFGVHSYDEKSLSDVLTARRMDVREVIKKTRFENIDVLPAIMKLEAELNKIHGRIIKLLDSIKGYEMESRRVRLEERKYNLAKQKLSGAYDIDPDTGEINDEAEEPDELEI